MGVAASRLADAAGARVGTSNELGWLSSMERNASSISMLGRA